MHLKGERELKAEELYDIITDEFSTEYDKHVIYCKSLGTDNMDKIIEDDKKQVIMFHSMQTLFSMELSLDDINTLINVSNKSGILVVLASFIENINTDRLEEQIRTFIKISKAMGV